MTELPTRLAPYVNAGVILLDAAYPGWRGDVRNKISREEFDMGSIDSDVLGCLYGNYLTGLRQLGVRKRDAHHVGFALPSMAGEWFPALTDAELTALWIPKIWNVPCS